MKWMLVAGAGVAGTPAESSPPFFALDDTGASSVAFANGAGVVTGTAASSPPFFALFLPLLAATDDTEASVAFADGFLCLPRAVAAEFVVVVVVTAAAVAIATTPVTGCFCLFPRRGDSPSSPSVAMGYRLRVVMSETTQSNTGTRIMKLPEGDISMELAADMKNIFFSVLAVYSGIVKILMFSKPVKAFAEGTSLSKA